MTPFVKEKDFMAPSLRELSAEQTEGVFATAVTVSISFPLF